MTVIYSSPIFGPIHSRRLGVSLGINLMPDDGKCCSFDCIYCECGFNCDFVPQHSRPTREQVRMALEAKLVEMKADGLAPDVLTFAGNGEPTLHPDFPCIIDDTIALRDRYFPQANVSVLSNSSQIVRQEIFDALCRVDNNMCKLDTVSAEYVSMVDRPNGHYVLEDIISQLRKFGKRCIIQTMFMRGEYQGRCVDNTSEAFVAPWLETIKYISPREVMVYTIDRETPAHGLEKASHDTLDTIANRVRALGLPCKVAY